jgi:CRISPR-associated protein Cas5h
MAIVFETSSNMAMFRKPYTTTSSVSFAFPPPTAIAGLISAIVGIDNRSGEDPSNASFWTEMKGNRIALRILQPFRWMRQSVNFWNIKDPQNNAHIQVKHQFLSNPGYRIFVEGPLELPLKERLKRGHFVYTPYLGVAYALADLSYIGCFDPEGIEDSPGLQIDTVIPWDKGVELSDIRGSGGAFKEQVPFIMDTQRKLLKSIAVLYSPSPDRKLTLKNRGSVYVSRCGEDVVAWFPEW